MTTVHVGDIDKTTVVIFRKGGNLSFHDHFFTDMIF